mgnify:CR=1 FL=1
MKKELFQIIMLSVLLIYFIYHGGNDERFLCVLHNHSHPNLSFCDYIPHHKVMKKKQKTNRTVTDMYIKKPSLILQEWFFVWSIAGSNR